MAISLIKDDNYAFLFGSAGLRPDFAHMFEVTTGAAITEQSIATLNVAANQNAQRQAFISVTALTNPCYFSVGLAGAAPADNTTMIVIPTTNVIYMKLQSTDVSFYYKQITAAGTLKVTAWV